MKSSPIILLKFSDLLDAGISAYRNKNFIILEESDAQSDVMLNQFYKTGYFGLMLVEAGESCYSVGDYRYEMEQGDMLFIVPGENFKVHFVSKDFNAKYLFFNTQMVNDAGFNYRSNDIIKSFSNHPSYLIKGNQMFFNRLKNYTVELAHLNDIRNTIFYGNEMIWHLFSLIMYEIEEFFRQTKSISIPTSREETITTDFYLLVQSYYNKHHDVQFYADQLHISRKYLSKVVKKTMGRTPKDIINHVILIEAKVLLKGRTSNIGLVADLLNFKEPAAFSKFFKKLTQKSPYAYKKEELF